MTSDSEDADAVEQLLETPDLATALESEQFKKFLDQVPIAIAVSDLSGRSASSMPIQSSRNCQT